MPSLSFAKDIRPLFTNNDVEEMIAIAGFDLSKYGDVKDRAQSIYERVEDGSMPCDEPWPAERVATFKSWMESGMTP
ncbi:MAG: hypothetical protein EXR62_12755 [Chloroflexi bacterium]|nr:hypothetical protein [Chloroflexota bacterium]